MEMLFQISPDDTSPSLSVRLQFLEPVTGTLAGHRLGTTFSNYYVMQSWHLSAFRTDQLHVSLWFHAVCSSQFNLKPCVNNHMTTLCQHMFTFRLIIHYRGTNKTVLCYFFATAQQINWSLLFTHYFLQNLLLWQDHSGLKPILWLSQLCLRICMRVCARTFSKTFSTELHDIPCHTQYAHPVFADTVWSSLESMFKMA